MSLLRSTVRSIVQAGLDRRTARPNRPVHVLAAPCCARRPDPRPVTTRAPRPVRRRPRPGRVDRAMLEADEGGVFNATGSGVSWVDSSTAADRDVGRRRVPPRARGRRVDGAAALDRRSRLGRDASDGCVTRTHGGAAFRPLAQTVADTLAHAEPVDGVGLSPEREDALLAAYVGYAGVSGGTSRPA